VLRTGCHNLTGKAGHKLMGKAGNKLRRVGLDEPVPFCDSVILRQLLMLMRGEMVIKL